MIELDGSSLTLEELIAIADAGAPVALKAAARERVRQSRAVVERRARGDERPVRLDAPAMGKYD